MPEITETKCDENYLRDLLAQHGYAGNPVRLSLRDMPAIQRMLFAWDHRRGTSPFPELLRRISAGYVPEVWFT